MKDKLKVLILVILIIAVIVLIGFLVFNAVRSINYNKNAQNPIVTLDVEDYGQVKIELYPDYAPNTVTYFIKLVENGFYDGKVIFGTDGSVIGAGMLANTSTEENDETANTEETTEADNTDETTENTTPASEEAVRVSDLDKSVTPYNENDSSTSEEIDYKVSLEGEFVANGYNDNTIRFEKGVIGFYRQDYNMNESIDLSSESYNSATSLFFIETTEDSYLNGEYAAFGKVIEGMDIIESMLNNPLSEEQTTVGISSSDTTSFFETMPVIKKATVDTFGVDYGMPKYLEAFDYNQYLTNLILQQYGY